MASKSSRTLCLTDEHVRRFAEASGDRNPLHVDESFARRTPYGRPIVHGALATIAGLGSADPEMLRHVEQIDIQFRSPVFPGERYAVSHSATDGGDTRVEIAWAGRAAATIALRAGAAAPLPEPADRGPVVGRSAPEHHRVGGLADFVAAANEPYAPRLDALAALAAELGAEDVPPGLLVWLAAASYVVGMVVPGRDAVFAGARILRSVTESSGTLDASVTIADDRTGLVIVDAAVNQGEASARMTLQALLRPPVPPPDRASIGRYLPPSTNLAGRNVLVVGASRGLGAALSGALATQSATVWASFAHGAEQAERLRQAFGEQRIRPLAFDAADVEQTRLAFDSLRAEAGALDGVVLCAAPPLYDAPLHPDASEAMLRFVESSVAMTLIPLACALELLSSGGWIVVMSSSALDDPPAPWPHYVLAKSALEGAAAYCARHTPARVLVARPPKMRTESMNTPLGAIGAVAPEQVAASIVRWVLSAAGESGVSLLTPKEIQA